MKHSDTHEPENTIHSNKSESYNTEHHEYNTSHHPSLSSLLLKRKILSPYANNFVKNPYGNNFVKSPYQNNFVKSPHGNNFTENPNAPRVHAKLKVSSPGDQSELEAERMADRVLSMKDGEIQTGSLSGENHIYAKSSGGITVDTGTESRLNSLGHGRPFPDTERSFYEKRFGSDFSKVRVHNDTQSHDLAESINAKAFTKGTDIVFGEGEYRPGTNEGKKLLAHELAHVDQGGGDERIYRELNVEDDSAKKTQEKLDEVFPLKLKKRSLKINIDGVLNYFRNSQEYKEILEQCDEYENWNDFWKDASPVVHTALDIAGLIPFLGDPLDAVNALIYAVEGDKVNTALSLIAMTPIFGWVSTAGKNSSRFNKVCQAVKESTMKVVKKFGKKVPDQSTEEIVNEILEDSSKKIFREAVEKENKISKELVEEASEESGKQSAKGGIESSLKFPKVVQSRINLRNGSVSEGAGWKHVLSEHFNLTKNKSQFTISPDELRSILQSKSVVKTPISRALESVDGIRYVREVKLSKPIGTDKFNHFQPTSIITILTDKFGNLVTASPGVIK